MSGEFCGCKVESEPCDAIGRPRLVGQLYCEKFLGNYVGSEWICNNQRILGLWTISLCLFGFVWPRLATSIKPVRLLSLPLHDLSKLPYHTFDTMFIKFKIGLLCYQPILPKANLTTASMSKTVITRLRAKLKSAVQQQRILRTNKTAINILRSTKKCRIMARVL